MWKKGIAALLLLVMLLSCASAETISPITGLPIEGEPTAPMMVVISHVEGKTEVKGHTITALGLGKHQAWGGQQADIIYESPMYREGWSRLTYLYHDALVNGEVIKAGPIRSVRTVHPQLMQCWGAGLISAAGFRGLVQNQPELQALWPRVFEHGMDAVAPYLNMKTGRRAPDHRSVDVGGIYQHLADKTFTATGFTFTDDAPNASLPAASEIRIDWNTKKKFFTRLVYDEQQNRYLCYSGKAPLKNWHDDTFQQESQLSFANVIVQYLPVGYPNSNNWPHFDLSGGGRAQIFMGGRMVEAEWINRDGGICYVDADGNDIALQRGQTYIAHWPDDLPEISWK